MSDAADIMAPGISVPIRGGSENVIVQEMNWKASKAFLKALAVQAAIFLVSDGQGNVRVDEAKLVGVLMHSIGDELMAAATGKDRDWVEHLSFTDATSVLDAAIMLNLRPEMIDGAKNVVRRLSTLVGTATSRTPTTTSSGSDAIPGSTSTPALGGS